MQENNRISRKKVYAKIGDIESGHGIRCSIHRVVGVELIRNQHTNEHQKEENYDMLDLNIIEEITNSKGEIVGYNKHEFDLFGKRGVRL
tara:strand:- start:304 stop:570 length:267 start_codon:yes stop_codon:yes gene_type:complete